jgi:hypothetical protein
LLALALQLVLLLIFLAFYSLFVSAIIFAVRKDMSSLKFAHYLREMIQKFTVRIFIFYAVYALAAFAIISALFAFGAPVILTSLLLLVSSVLLMFVPQAIVLDEAGIANSVLNSLEFIRIRPRDTAYVLVVGSALLAISILIGFAIDSVALVGSYVVLALVLIVVMPLLEILKSSAYMFKHGLIRAHQLTAR